MRWPLRVHRRLGSLRPVRDSLCCMGLLGSDGTLLPPPASGLAAWRCVATRVRCAACSDTALCGVAGGDRCVPVCGGAAAGEWRGSLLPGVSFGFAPHSRAPKSNGVAHNVALLLILVCIPVQRGQQEAAIQVFLRAFCAGRAHGHCSDPVFSVIAVGEGSSAGGKTPPRVGTVCE